MPCVGVDEWLVNVVKSMYVGASTAVKLGGGESVEFGVKVGVHQGSVLSPLLFNIVLEALSREFREGLPWELLYADDLALMAVTKEELLEKVKRWKDGMERKGLRVNIGKTKVMKCCINSTPLSDSGKWPCGVCRRVFVRTQFSVWNAKSGCIKNVRVSRVNWWRGSSSLARCVSRMDMMIR